VLYDWGEWERLAGVQPTKTMLSPERRNIIANDPTHRQLLAFEPNDSEIKRSFIAVPSALVIVTPSRQIWREDFFAPKPEPTVTKATDQPKTTVEADLSQADQMVVEAMVKFTPEFEKWWTATYSHFDVETQGMKGLARNVALMTKVIAHDAWMSGRKPLVETLKWYAGNLRPEDRVNDNGDKAETALGLKLTREFQVKPTNPS